jgi:rhodanese-related sulfurtransferase
MPVKSRSSPRTKGRRAPRARGTLPETPCWRVSVYHGPAHPFEFLTDDFTLPGAHRFSPEELTAHLSEIPRDRDIVLYCTCPSETTAAKTAAILTRLGIERVRPLRGVFDQWKRLEPIS